MRDQSFLWFILALCVAASSAQAETKRLATKPASESAVVELGKIGTSAPSDADKNATLKKAPSKQAALPALKAKGNGSASLGPTYRVSPRTLYDPHIGVYLWCTESAGIISTLGNHWQCQSGQYTRQRVRVNGGRH